MLAPVDYPIEDAARDAQFSVDELSYAVFLDRQNSQDAESDGESDELLSATLPIRDLPDFTDEPPRVSGWQRKTPRPLANLAQSLLANEAAHRRTGSASVISRFARAIT